MFYLTTNNTFLSIVRLITLCVAVALGVVLMVGQAKAGSSDFEPGGRYDFSPPTSMNYECLNPSTAFPIAFTCAHEGTETPRSWNFKSARSWTKGQ